MGNKNTTSLPVMTDVEVRPRCVHRGCILRSYAGFVMCVEHVKAAKQKQMEEDEEKANIKKDGTVLQSPARSSNSLTVVKSQDDCGQR